MSHQAVCKTKKKHSQCLSLPQRKCATNDFLRAAQLSGLGYIPMNPLEDAKDEKGQRMTFSWSSVAPRKGTERNRLYEECGSKCFLLPEKKGFPICAALPVDRPYSVFDPEICLPLLKGIKAAHVRAVQYDHDNIAEEAKILRDSISKKPVSKRNMNKYIRALKQISQQE